MGVINIKPTSMRFRRSGSALIASTLGLIVIAPLTGSVIYGLSTGTENRSLMLALLPLAVILPIAVLLSLVWAYRTGVDVSKSGIRVRAPFGSRFIDWEDIEGFRPVGRQVYVIEKNNKAVLLPTINKVDLAKLVAVSGQNVDMSDSTAQTHETATAA